MWLCPKCRLPLNPNQTAPACAGGHCYDRARQGYLNLLLANKKNSRHPGDNAAMVDARSEFLRAGFYKPLADLLRERVVHHAAAATFPRIADIGCGEGYYLETVAAGLGEPAELYGIDISKSAIRKAAVSGAKSGLTRARYAVASSYDIPLPNQSLDLCLSVFAPFSESEVCRVLKPGGAVVRVTPGPRHLYQLKQMIYSEVRLHSNPQSIPGCELMESTELQFMLHIAGEENLENLLAMTPFNWHGHGAAKQSMLEQNQHQIEASFCVQVMRLRASAS